MLHPIWGPQNWEAFDQLKQVEQRATKIAGAGSCLCCEEGAEGAEFVPSGKGSLQGT